MAKTLELQFFTSMGKSAKVSIDNPIEPVNPAAVKLAMERIVLSNVFATQSGDLAAVDSARVIERNVTDYDII